jgi:hypothetical protein
MSQEIEIYGDSIGWFTCYNISMEITQETRFTPTRGVVSTLEPLSVDIEDQRLLTYLFNLEKVAKEQYIHIGDMVTCDNDFPGLRNVLTSTPIFLGDRI